jgi:hypothetical protein
MQVRGIGEKNFAKLQGLIVLGERGEGAKAEAPKAEAAKSAAH